MAEPRAIDLAKVAGEMTKVTSKLAEARTAFDAMDENDPDYDATRIAVEHAERDFMVLEHPPQPDGFRTRRDRAMAQLIEEGWVRGPNASDPDEGKDYSGSTVVRPPLGQLGTEGHRTGGDS